MEMVAMPNELWVYTSNSFPANQKKYVYLRGITPQMM